MPAGKRSPHSRARRGLDRRRNEFPMSSATTCSPASSPSTPIAPNSNTSPASPVRAAVTAPLSVARPPDSAPKRLLATKGQWSYEGSETSVEKPLPPPDVRRFATLDPEFRTGREVALLGGGRLRYATEARADESMLFPAQTKTVPASAALSYPGGYGHT